MTVQIIEGDCRDVLATLPAHSVHCVVTSPPYFGLRDYGVDGQIGLEPTPDAFVAELVAVFREVRRALRDDGTVWLNLGDSYAGSWGAQGRQGSTGEMSGRAVSKHRGRSNMSAAQIAARPNRCSHTGSIRQEVLKPKDLIGIPWRVAFALQADGWYLRQDIIWAKPNPMPESVTDRCTKSHEYVFLLSKSARYFYDQEAIAEPVATSTVERLSQDIEGRAGSDRVPGKTNGAMKAVSRSGNKERKPSSERGCPEGSGSNVCGSVPWEGDTRNARSVWTIATQPFKEAHFATFPPNLAERCIKAGCPKGGTVLDPFGGAGTTGLVADRLQRNAVLIELNPAYAEMARRRIEGDAPLLMEASQARAGRSAEA
jgi:DNA modification methylase